MNSVLIDGPLFAVMVRGGTENLRRNKTVVNDLNVFPVPDGDTGDNMYMTFKSGCDSANAKTSDLGSTSKEAARGMLLGARGNSGVILSRIFAGIADALEGRETSDVKTMCAAFESGVKKAYGAVSTPVEGTILTVYREAAEYVTARQDKYSTFEELFEDFLTETKNSLERTPDLLKVLKEAGVVDSGGAGLYYIIEGMRKALDLDIEIPDEIKESAEQAKADATLTSTDERLEDGEGIVYGYCTEFLLQLMQSKCRGKEPEVSEVIKWLTEEVGGESIVAFRDGDIIKVHVHTLTPGRVIDHFQQYGEYLKLKIENMTLQNKAVKIQNNFAPKLREDRPRQKYAVVAAVSGEGFMQMFTEAGADALVDGGQSNNPPAEKFLEAFDRVNAENIIVLPNNKNILLTAEQAAELYTKANVLVFPSKNLGEGYAALTCFDREAAGTEELLEQMKEGSESVVTGLISKAVRDSAVGEIKVKSGEYIGFVGSDILAAAADITAAAEGLCEKLDADSHDIVIAAYGNTVTEEEAAALCEALTEKFPKTEFAPAFGGQPIYDYVLIFE